MPKFAREKWSILSRSEKCLENCPIQQALLITDYSVYAAHQDK
jgi:hypothetical protein